ncbi:MAG TPA: tetratricopeptide repeat protein [Verrucomicrobiae bacterium]|nr:tetratricopeptide repeat protein [Verrucomicrobiae bacterium]
MTAERSPKHFALICLVLALGTAALYWPITNHPFILYDDEQYITTNVHVTTGLSWENFKWAFTTGEAANWHPLTWLSHQLDCTLFGLNAGGHHLVSLLFHIANTLLVFIFLRGVTGALWRSALVAALFAWHPLHVESVAWAAERKDVLSTFFWMLTLLAYGRYVRQRSWVAYGAALVLFACGLMSKPMVVTLPCVLFLLDFWPLQRMAAVEFEGPGWKTLILEKIPFFVLAVAGSVVTYLVQAGGGAVWHAPLPERLANAVIAYALYFIKIFYPTHLTVIYALPKHWPVLLALGAAALLAVGTMAVMRCRRSKPFLAMGWFWFLGTLVPTIGLVQVGAQAMADRYTYIPSIGLFVALVWGGAEWVAARPEWKKISVVVAGGVLLGCALVTAKQISYWGDNVSLFMHAIEVSPDNYVADNLLGKAFERNGDQVRAVVLYENSVKLEPRFPQSQYNCALSLFALGQTDEGIGHLQAAALLVPRDADTQFALGFYFSKYGSWTNAVNCYSNAVAVRSGFASAQRDYGVALGNLGRFGEAVGHLREALRLQPDLAGAKEELERVLAAHPEVR